MQFTIDFKYTEHDVIPPRARKPRDVMHDDGHEIFEIRELSGEEAPVAILDRATVHVDGQSVEKVVDYRWWDDRLWTPWWPAVGDGKVTTTDARYITLMLKDRLGYGYHTLENTRKAIEEYVNGHVFIDGLAYERAEEPMYRLVTNHWSGHAVFITVERDFSPGRGVTLEYWGANQWSEVLAEANMVRDRFAEAFGEDFEFEAEQRLTVLMPEVLRRDPQTEAIAAETERNRQNALKAVAVATKHCQDAIEEIDKALGTFDDLSLQDARAVLDAALIHLTAVAESHE